MQLESRIRRQREFLSFLLEKFSPKCYWCDQVIDSKSFDIPVGHDPDPLTIHHENEDHDDNRIENKTLIHKTCHQEMHKLSTKVGLPPLLIREAKMQQMKVKSEKLS